MIKEFMFKKEIVMSDGSIYIDRPTEITIKGEVYHFITNTQKKSRINLQKAAELNGYKIVFIDNACDMYAQPLPECCATYMLKSDYDKFCSMDRLFNTSSEISLRYRENLKERGYAVENIPLSEIYLGCERTENIPLKTK